jgi:steroid 5-alpha reductase family enzyme
LAHRGRSWLVVVCTYAVAMLVAWGVWRSLDHSPLVGAFVADVAATLVVFGFSYAFRNSSLYDAYWSVVPPVLALAWLVPSPRAWLVLAVVIVWAVRLTVNWGSGWTGLEHEDWRYVDLQRKTGRAYWAVSLFGIHLFPTVQVFLGCLPLYFVVTATEPLTGLGLAAVSVTGIAVWIEALADRQLRAHVRSNTSNVVCEAGLWRYSRHPNYFGEMGFWWGLFLCGLTAGAPLWTGVGATAITVMFYVVSVPMMEARSVERRPGYAEHQGRVAALIPWFRKDG